MSKRGNYNIYIGKYKYIYINYYYLLFMVKKLKCGNCNYKWDYKGKSKYYATCPRCLTKVNVKTRGC